MHMISLMRVKRVDVGPVVPVRGHESPVTGKRHPDTFARHVHVTDDDGTTVELTLHAATAADIAMPGDPAPEVVPHEGDHADGGPGA